MRSHSGATLVELLQYMKTDWQRIRTYDVLIIMCKFNGATTTVKDKNHPDKRFRDCHEDFVEEPAGYLGK